MTQKKYPAYKPSGVEWIGEIPRNWASTSLKRLVLIPVTDGPHETPTFTEAGVPFVSAEAIQNGTVNFSACRGFISKEEDERFSLKCKPQKGDVFVVKSGSTTGKVAYVNTDINFNIWSPIALVRAAEKQLGRFLYYALSSSYFQTQVQLFWSFGTQPNIGMNVLENLQVVYPTEQEQKAITSYLDKKTALIDSTIRQKERLIELLQEERTAIINRVVTRGLDPDVPMKDTGVEWLGQIPEHWEVKKLKYVAENVATGSTPPTSEAFYYDNGSFNWYAPGDFNDSFIIQESVRKINYGCVTSGIIKTYPPGAVLIVGIGATVGKSALCTSVCSSNQQVNAVVFNNLIDSWYGLFFFRAIQPVFKNMSNSATLPIVNQSQLKDLVIPVPPLSEQKDLVKYILSSTDKIDQTVEKEYLNIKLLQEYRTALINEVVTGKRCVIIEPEQLTTA